MRGDFGTITLHRTASGWMAAFSGQVAETVRFAFGRTTIATAFTAEASSAQVQHAIAARWKDCLVVLAAAGRPSAAAELIDGAEDLA